MADVQPVRSSSTHPSADAFPFLKRSSDDLNAHNNTPKSQQLPSGDQEKTAQTSPSRPTDPPRLSSSGLAASPRTSSSGIEGPSQTDPSRLAGPSRTSSSGSQGPSVTNPAEFEGPWTNPAEFEGPSQTNPSRSGGPSSAAFIEERHIKKETCSPLNSPTNYQVQASEERTPSEETTPFEERRASFGEESPRKRLCSRPPSSETRERNPARLREGYGEEGEKMRREHGEGEVMGVHPHPHLHHLPYNPLHPDSGHSSPKFQKDRPKFSPEGSDKHAGRDDTNRRPSHHHEDLASQPSFPQREFSTDLSHNRFQPQLASPRWTESSTKDFYENATASTSQAFSSSRWESEFRSPGKFEAEPEESLDLSTHRPMSTHNPVSTHNPMSTHNPVSTHNPMSTHNPVSASNVHARDRHQGKRFPFSPEAERSSLFHFSAEDKSPKKSQIPERRQSSTIHLSEERRSPARTQVPRERERAHTFSASRERASSLSGKDRGPASSSSTTTHSPRNGELHSPFHSSSKLFSSPFSSSSSSALSCTPPPSYNPEHSSTSKQEPPLHDPGNERVDPAREGSESMPSAFPEERRKPACTSSGHPAFSAFPPPMMPSVERAAFPGGWSPYQSMILPGGLAGPLPRIALLPLMGVPPPTTAGGGGEDESGAENTGQAQQFWCHKCEYIASSQEEFDEHMSVHYKFACPQCGYMSRTEGRLLKHIRDFHSDPKKHKRKTSRPRVFRCRHCDFTTTDRNDNWRHRRKHISPDKLLECPRCPFVSEYKHHLQFHLRNHLASKPFNCVKCNYCCVNKSMLNSHMKSHTKACQFRCADCNFAAKYSHSMKQHARKYNHRIGPTLNSDGSLPQYNARRGGKKGLYRSSSSSSSRPKNGDSRGEGGFMPGFFPVPPPPPSIPPPPSGIRPPSSGIPPPPPGIPHGTPGLNPMMHNGMFPFPFWPAVVNNSQRPPPLFDLRAMGGPAFTMPAVPDNAGRFGVTPSLRTEQDEKRLGSREKRGYTCTMCPYTCDAQEKLIIHVLKVHASENTDQRNMILSKVPDMSAYNSHSRPSPGRRVSTSSSTASETFVPQAAHEASTGKKSLSSPYAHHSSETEGRSNRAAETVSKPSMAFDQNLYSEHFERANVGSYRDSPYLERQRSQERDAYERQPKQQSGNQEDSGQVNILQQMTERFGGVASTSPAPFVSRIPLSTPDKPEEQDSERREPQSQDEAHRLKSPVGKESTSSIFQNKPADNLTSGMKRQHPETEVPSGQNSTPEPFFQPRKRSRKGKAFKLDTLYLKRQEQQQQLEAMNSISENSQTQKMIDADHREEDKEPKNSAEEISEKAVHNDPCNALPVEEDEHFKRLQKSIQLLNSDPSRDNLKSSHEQDPERAVIEAEKDSRPVEEQSQSQQEKDPEKDREEFIQSVCMNRRRSVSAPLRRGSEVAWNMIMKDPTLGLKLPPEAMFQSAEEEASSSPPGSTPSVSTSRHHSFSEGQAAASFRSPDKSRRMSVPWSTSSPYTMTRSGSQGEDVNVPSSPEANAIALTRKDNAMPGSQNPSAWMKLNMPVPPFHYELQSPGREMSRFRHYSHRSSTSSQTVGMPPIPEYMPEAQHLFAMQPPRAYPTPYVGRSYECHYCEMSFRNIAQYNLHMSFHKKDNPFECRGCGFKSANKVEFYRHLIMVEHN